MRADEVVSSLRRVLMVLCAGLLAVIFILMGQWLVIHITGGIGLLNLLSFLEEGAMHQFRQRCLQVLRFLRGTSLTSERDRVKRGLLILALALVVGALLLGGVLVVTTPPSTGGGALIVTTPTHPPTATPTPIPTPTSTPVPPIPAFQHIFEIVLENTSYDRLIGNPQAPYFNALAKQYGLATQFYSVTHPSLPNYLVLTGGSQFGVSTDCTADSASCTQDQPNLADAIEQSGRTWVAYFESMPTPCDTEQAFPYSIHYNPFVYYADIVNNGPRCQSHVLPYTQAQFFATLSSGQVPNFVWIAPNLAHDMHEGYSTPALADHWLATNVAKLLASPVFQQQSLLLITFDEGNDTGTPDTAGCCGAAAGGGHIATLVISPLARQGFQSTLPENHYNLLRTIETAWGLPPLGHTTAVQPMTEFFASTPARALATTAPGTGRDDGRAGWPSAPSSLGSWATDAILPDVPCLRLSSGRSCLGDQRGE